MKKVVLLFITLIAAWYFYPSSKKEVKSSVITRKKIAPKLVVNSDQVKLENKQIVKTQELEEPFDTLEKLDAHMEFMVFPDYLFLELVEVTNPLKWTNGISNFEGEVVIDKGEIEIIRLKIADKMNIDISGFEMEGNSFKYYENDQELYGLAYQVDENSYMISFERGVLEGTRLKFQNKEEQKQMGYNLNRNQQ